MSIFARLERKEMDAARERIEQVFLYDRVDQLGDLFRATLGLCSAAQQRFLSEQLVLSSRPCVPCKTNFI